MYISLGNAAEKYWFYYQKIILSFFYCLFWPQIYCALSFHLNHFEHEKSLSVRGQVENCFQKKKFLSWGIPCHLFPVIFVPDVGWGEGSRWSTDKNNTVDRYSDSVRLCVFSNLFGFVRVSVCAHLKHHLQRGDPM